MNNIGVNLIRTIQNNIYNSNLRYISTFKSAISLKSLYPNGCVKTTIPIESKEQTEQRFSGYIPINQLQITYSRSSGPGGQNVNKVNTKVDLRFHLESANWLDNTIKKRLIENLRTKITIDGFLVFRSDVTRSQQLNLANCLEKLRSAIYLAVQPASVQSTETAEMLRRRYERATAKRLMEKKQRSTIKQGRQSPTISDV